MNRRYFPLIILAGTMVLTGAVFFGAESIDPRVLLDQTGAGAVDRMILIHLRIPRVLTAFLAGGSLAFCGMVFQSIFRNPLATPYTLGVSSGASLGAVAVLTLGTGRMLIGPIAPTVPGALIGALVVICAVYMLAGRMRRLAGNTLLLSGVAINLFCASLILLLQYMGGQQETVHVVRWLMGSLSGATYAGVGCLVTIFVPALWTGWRFRHELDMMLTGHDLTVTRGVDIRHTVLVLYFVMSLLTGMVVAFCGPIGFIGIIVPHLCRRICSYRHDRLMFPAIVCGGVLLVICDVLARSILPPAEIPVGIIMALLGGPFFLVILLKKSKA